MPRSSRLPYVALRGCLIVGSLLGALSAVLAQEAEKPSVPNAQSQQAQPDQAEPLETPAAGPPEQKEAPPPLEQSQARDPDYYAVEDLDAQRRMAVGAERLVEFTWWQTVIIAVEAALLVCVLFFTAWAALAATRAARAADKAVELTAETAERQLRAYVHPSKSVVELGEDGTVAFSVHIENSGQTPAYQMSPWTQITVWAHPLEGDLPSLPVDPVRSASAVLHAGGRLRTEGKFSRPVSAEKRAAIASAELAIYVYGHVKYRDVFDKERFTIFRFMYHGPWGGTQDLAVCPEGNDAT